MAKAPRNKTIDFTVDENDPGRKYLSEALKIHSPATEQDVHNRIILDDLFQSAPLLPAESVDLLIADPPYNLTKDFGNMKFTKTSPSAYVEFTRRWIESIYPLLKKNASIYVCCDWESSSAIGSVLGEFFNIQNRITWQREKGRGALRNWKNGMEDIWFATKSKDYVFNVEDVKIRRKVIAPYRVNGKPKDWKETSEGNFRDTFPSNFWDDISIPYWSMPENTAHPTQKSEKLMAKLILASSNPGDMVFDPFMGSGSTAVTAKKLGRNFFGVEANEQYCAWAYKRIEMAESDPSIQGYADGVFWERNTSAEQKSAKREKNFHQQALLPIEKDRL